jgi:hypothetical protein
VETSAERAYLAEVESRLGAGEQVEIEISLVLIAGQEVELDDDELRGATRRAVQLLAAGGDPKRELDPESRAVSALASDLDSPARRAALTAGFASLRETVEGLSQVASALERLAADDAQAWRWFACTLLAEELLGE